MPTGPGVKILEAGTSQRRRLECRLHENNVTLVAKRRGRASVSLLYELNGKKVRRRFTVNILEEIEPMEIELRAGTSKAIDVSPVMRSLGVKQPYVVDHRCDQEVEIVEFEQQGTSLQVVAKNPGKVAVKPNQGL